MIETKYYLMSAEIYLKWIGKSKGSRFNNDKSKCFLKSDYPLLKDTIISYTSDKGVVVDNKTISYTENGKQQDIIEFNHDGAIVVLKNAEWIDESTLNVEARTVKAK